MDGSNFTQEDLDIRRAVGQLQAQMSQMIDCQKGVLESNMQVSAKMTELITTMSIKEVEDRYLKSSVESLEARHNELEAAYNKNRETELPVITRAGREQSTWDDRKRTMSTVWFKLAATVIGVSLFLSLGLDFSKLTGG